MLEGPPNNWTKDEVDSNMRPLLNSARLRVGLYDRKSIMHYSLAPGIFIAGVKSNCYVPENDELSPSDRTAFALSYPKDHDGQVRYLNSLQSQSVAILTLPNDDDNKTRTLIENKINEILEGQHPGYKVNLTTGDMSPIINHNSGTIIFNK